MTAGGGMVRILFRRDSTRVPGMLGHINPEDYAMVGGPFPASEFDSLSGVLDLAYHDWEAHELVRRIRPFDGLLHFAPRKPSVLLLVVDPEKHLRMVGLANVPTKYKTIYKTDACPLALWVPSVCGWRVKEST